ncbi:TetR/AcrR family transcriptional regulator [Pedobacter sp. BS3]|uniref:TetR/AcrR family transcriptional regulator n=1 Tax=Pedobacter sp. BS3 TaxID=2567937 RepID=UPI0011EEE111|nr:TetR/AcrR family transcriptional regulator [Pedobacter sp. BS3]TZF82708.1 TetR/AcrR family transcriptional regulator [Pedobacter sp. BS3]
MGVRLDDTTCKRSAIVNSAIELIKDHGFHGTPISQIARNAGVAPATIYHYFPCKDELISDIYVQVKNDMALGLMTDDDPGKPFKARFLALWIRNCRYYIHHESVLNFLEQYVNSPYLKLYPEKESAIWQEKVIGFYRWGIDNGHLKPIEFELLAPIIRGSIVATAKLHHAKRREFTYEELENMALIIWDGIKAH